MYYSTVPRYACAAIAAVTLIGASARAQLITLDPDAYPEGTVLNTIIPGLSMITVAPDNLPYQPRSFDVTAELPNLLFYPAPTGDKVFAHAGIPFWNDVRRLRMDFSGVVSSVSILFMGSTSVAVERGQLEVYGIDGQLLDSYTTQPLLGGQIEAMAIQHNQADIAWAVAYTLPGDSVFGRLDHLVFSQPVAVPEPGAVALLCVFGGLLLLRLGRRHR